MAICYRDYVAYCGVSDDGKKPFAVCSRWGGVSPSCESAEEEMPAECPAPAWERRPARVTFAADDQKMTYSVRGHAADSVSEDNEDEEKASK